MQIKFVILSLAETPKLFYRFRRNLSWKVKRTQTEKNLLTAFAGESQARNRYTYFASKAKKEGYVQISLSNFRVNSQPGKVTRKTAF